MSPKTTATPQPAAPGAPVVALGRVRDLGAEISPEALRMYGDLAVWFFEDGRRSTLFERHEERSSTTEQSDEVMAAIEELAIVHEEALVALYGNRPDAQEFGFHFDATYDEVVAAFLADGFVIKPLPFGPT